MYRILTYDLSCESYHRLKGELNAKGIKPYGSTYTYQEGDIIVNWGVYGTRPYLIHINHPSDIRICTSKLRTFSAFNSFLVPTVEYTTDQQVAEAWLAGNNIVYARSNDHGKQGDGIQVLHPGQSVAESARRGAFFWTKGFPTHREFRVYTFRDKALCVYEKKDLMERNLNEEVRANNDWMYCRSNLDPYPLHVERLACAATQACGLDFSGVDVGLDSKGNVCVFEVNSAPWLGTYTARILADAIKRATSDQR